MRLPSTEVAQAALAVGVAGQRPGEGEQVLAPGPLHVDQGSVAAVHHVLGGKQAPGWGRPAERLSALM